MTKKTRTWIALVAVFALAIFLLVIALNSDKLTGKATYDITEGMHISSVNGKNIIANNQASNNGENDFVIKGTDDVEVYGTTVSSHPTTFSFSEYAGDFYFKGVDSIPSPPSGKLLINKAVEVTGEGYIELGIHYESSDLGDVSESTLQLYRYDADNSEWELIDGSYVDTNNNIVYGNLTEFSIFAPLGAVSAGPTPFCGDQICNNGETCSTCPGDCGGCSGAETAGGGEADVNPQGGGAGTTAYTTSLVHGVPQTFNLPVNGYVRYTFAGQTHTVTITGMTVNTVSIVITSNVLSATLRIGEAKRFDVDGNGMDDLEVTLVSKTASTAQLRVTALAEAAGAAIPSVTPAQAQFISTTLLLIILLVIGVIVGGIIVLKMAPTAPRTATPDFRREHIMNDILKPYVARAKTLGVSPDRTREALIAYGWPEDLANEVTKD